LEAREQIPVGGVVTLVSTVTGVGSGQYSVPLYGFHIETDLANQDMYGEFIHSTRLKDFIQSVEFSAPNQPGFITFPAPRAGISLIFKPNFAMIEDQWDTTAPNCPGGFTPSKLLAKTNVKGTPNYPAGAQQISEVAFSTEYANDGSGPIQSVVAGQTYSIVLDGVSFSHLADGTDALDQYRESIYDDLIAQIDADPDYIATANRLNRPDGTGDFISSITIKQAAVNVAFTVELQASFGIIVNVINEHD